MSSATSGLLDTPSPAYGLVDGEEQSLRSIADAMGLSAERVRQLEQRALGKLAAAAVGERG